MHFGRREEDIHIKQISSVSLMIPAIRIDRPEEKVCLLEYSLT